MRSRSPSPTGWCLVIYCFVSLALSSNQNDTVGILAIENGIKQPEGTDINPEVEEVDVKEQPNVIANQNNLQSIPVAELPSQSASYDGILPSTEPPNILEESDVTVGEVTVPLESFDADLLIPSIEILTTTENPDVPVHSEIIPAGEFIPVDAQPIAKVESDLATNSFLNVSNNVTRNNESGSSEDDIPSFSEWTLKVLAEEEKSGANGSTGAQPPAKLSASPKLRQKNYASPDCGAKILAANSEAEHTSAVLDPSRDEYFLSICSAKIWFVIELCEAIQAQRVDIANFELFSSSPKDFRVYISDRYPTRDWASIGLFTAADERSIQSFPLERQLFGKFVKVELVSHYGKEHFCPISLFHVYGNSEYEVLDIEEDSRTGSSLHRQEEDSTEEEMLYDTKQNNSTNGEVVVVEGRNLFGSAKDAVINIVKKAAEVLGKSPSPDQVKETTNNNETEKEEKDLRKQSNACHTAAESVNVSRAINGSLSCEWKELTFLASLPWLHSSLVRQCQADSTDQMFSSIELAFAQSIWRPATIQALCHWILPDESIVLFPLDSVTPSVAEVMVTENVDSSTEAPLVEAVEPTAVEQPSATVELSELENLEQLFSDEMETVPTSPEDMPTGIEAKLMDGFIIEASKPTGQQQHHQQQRQQQTQKESVFVRLSNRIKVLERNMSLSGQYLEELSRRYKRQVDDMQKTLNRTLQTLNDTLQRMSTQEERHQTVLTQLHGDIAELKSSARILREENHVLRAQTMEQHLFLMMVEVIVIAVLVVFLVRNLSRPPSNLPPDPRNSPTHRQKQHQPVSLDYLLEVGQKVEDIQPASQSLSLNVSDMDVSKKKPQTSPTPSLADSSSSGCESAFSFPNSNHAASRDPSPIDLNKMRPKLGKNGSKKHHKKKKSNLNHVSTDKLSQVYHAKDVKSSSMPPPKIRLKSDNWEWHSRAKILAAQFIKENCQTSGMRSSF